MNTYKEQTMEPGFSPALMDEVTRAAALQGISDGELLRSFTPAGCKQSVGRALY